jgi:2'-5' RNA ligase
MTATQTAQHRLFYALWPDTAVAEKLQVWQGAISGRKTHLEDFHLTLAFLGEQQAMMLPDLEAVLPLLPHQRLECVLDTYGHFERLNLVWVGMSAPPPGLFDLQRALRLLLLERGVLLPPERVFRPHITLARKARLDVGLTVPPPLPWHARSVVLARSGGGEAGGPRYQVLASTDIDGSKG